MYRATDSQSPDCISVRRASTALLCPPAREEKERNYSLPSSLLSAELYRMRMFSVSRGKVVSHGESIQSRRGSQSSRYSGDSSVPTRPHSRSSNPCLVQEVRTDLVKVLMLGASEVGKSSLCVQFVTSEHVNTYHSVGEAKHYITEHNTSSHHISPHHTTSHHITPPAYLVTHYPFQTTVFVKRSTWQ